MKEDGTGCVLVESGGFYTGMTREFLPRHVGQFLPTTSSFTSVGRSQGAVFHGILHMLEGAGYGYGGYLRTEGRSWGTSTGTFSELEKEAGAVACAVLQMVEGARGSFLSSGCRDDDMSLMGRSSLGKSSYTKAASRQAHIVGWEIVGVGSHGLLQDVWMYKRQDGKRGITVSDGRHVSRVALVSMLL